MANTMETNDTQQSRNLTARMNAQSSKNAWLMDYFHALLATQEEAANDHPEMDGEETALALRLAKTRTEIIQREKATHPHLTDHFRRA